MENHREKTHPFGVDLSDQNPVFIRFYGIVGKYIPSFYGSVMVYKFLAWPTDVSAELILSDAVDVGSSF